MKTKENVLKSILFTGTKAMREITSENHYQVLQFQRDIGKPKKSPFYYGLVGSDLESIYVGEQE